MAITDDACGNGMVMPVQPLYSGGYGFGGLGGFGGFGGMGYGGDWAWILLLLVLGGGWGGYRNSGSSGADDNYVLASDFSQISRQISDTYSMTDRKLDSVSNGLCDGFYSQAQLVNGVNSNIANAQYAMTSALTTNGYETRNAINGIGSQLAACCCDIREGISGVNYNSAINTNNIVSAIDKGFCQTNFNNSNSTRDIIQSQHCDADRILARLDAMETARQAEKIAELQAENQGLRFAASQQAQNAYLISELGQKCPKPAYVVQPPQTVTFPNSCGCDPCGRY